MKKEKLYSSKEINEVLNKNGLNFTFDELINPSLDIIWWKSLSHNWKVIMLYNHNYEYRVFSRGRIEDFDIVLAKIKQYNKFELEHFINELRGIKDFFFNFYTNLQVEDFTPLSKFSNLERIFLNGVRFSNLETMPTIETLKFLDAKGSTINSLLNISKFKNLEHLNIADTNISELKGIEELKKLKILNASMNDIESIKELKYLKNLNYLSIFQTSIKNLEAIKNLENLVTVYAYSTKINDLKSLFEIKSLKKININNTSVSDLLPLQNNLTLLEVIAKGTSVSIDNMRKLNNLLPETIILI